MLSRQDKMENDYAEIIIIKLIIELQLTENTIQSHINTFKHHKLTLKKTKHTHYAATSQHTNNIIY